jgi:subtilisin family serine protease
MIPNDPFYVGRQQWYYDLVNAPKAWDVETGKPGVIIAVLDTGLDVTHPDLKDNVWTNTGEIAGNGIDDDGNGCVDDTHGCNFADSSIACAGAHAAPNSEIADDNGHGTFVAGVAAAKGNNAIGVTGMAPNATIMPVKVLDCEGAGTALAATQGILYAAKNGAKVINMSFGADEDSLTLRAAIAEAHDRYGVVIVAATGNSGGAVVTFPARDESVIAVSATDHRSPDTKAPFSNWGPEVTVTAPGVDIASTLPTKFCGPGWSCVSGQPYALGSGTSFSAPLVAGAVALILSKGPPMSPDAVKSRLMTTADDLPDGAYAHWDGAGRIQTDLALEGKSYQVGVSGIVRN